MLGKMTDDEVLQFIRAHRVARLGCHDGDKIYVVPVSYLFFDKYFLCYSLDGLKIGMMRKNPQVCMEIDDVTNISNWKSVIATGHYEEITDEPGIKQAGKHLSESVLQLTAAETSLPPDATHPKQRTEPLYKDIIYYRIHIEELTGRFEKQLT